VRLGRDRRGSGIVVGDGQVLTNAHNLRGGAVTVTFAGGEQRSGTVLGADIEGDLAVVGVETPDGSAVTWGPEEESPRLGQSIFSLVNVNDGATRVTAGYVSAVDRAFRGPRGHQIKGGFEHTAPLAPGSSGGPVVDRDGRLLGINTHRLGDGFYLAVPTGSELRKRVESLARGEGQTRVRLGVGLAHPHLARKLRASVGLPERQGLLVQVVEEGSPAESAGIQRGDLLTRIGDKDLTNADDLLEALSGVAPGSSIELALVRGAEEHTVTVVFPDGDTTSATDEDLSS
jgi:serine protease Do